MSDKRTGATLPLVLFLLAALLGVAALAIDIGMMDWARQRAQNSADAAALAGGQALTSTAAAVSAANSVIAANNASGAVFQGVTIAVTPNASVAVRGYVNAPLSFAPAVGYAPTAVDGTRNTVSVSASATVALQNLCGLPSGARVAPFGLIGDDPNSTDTTARYAATLLNTAANSLTPKPGVYQSVTTAYGQPIILKLNEWDGSGKLIVRGNCDPLITSSSGTSYPITIRSISDQSLSIGQSLNTLNGSANMDQTNLGLAARLSPSNTQFTHRSATYNVWFYGQQEQTEGHLLIIPIVSQGVKDMPGSVTVLAWTAFWVDQPDKNASNWIAHGRFLGFVPSGGIAGGCTGAGGEAPRLIQ